MARPASPEMIGGYPIGQRLGEGGLGTVYATVGPRGEPLAIKVVAHGGDATLQIRVAREVDALRRLDHPNVLALADAGADETWSYVVMPRLAGTTLRELGRLMPESAALLVMHAARGAGAIHRAGLCHRDLKPDNIMITEDGRVVIIDLGLALATDWTRQTSEGSIAGSLPYMAPEQIEGAADARSDVWSLGVTWWELVTGTRPFARTRPLEEIAAIAAGARPAISEVERRLDDDMADLLERCLSREPGARPRDGNALADALGRLLAPEPGDAATIRRLLVDPTACEREVARRMADRCAARAAERAGAGDVFGAMRAIDRGLAYQPDDPALAQLLVQVMPASGTGHDRPRPRRWPWAAAVVTLAGAAGAAAIAAPSADERSYDFEDPKAVVQAAIDAVRSRDPELLPTLCIPDSTGTARRICDAKPGGADWPRVEALLAEAVVDGAYRTEGGAVVNLRNGERRVTVDLVRHGSRFYLGAPP